MAVLDSKTVTLSFTLYLYLFQLLSQPLFISLSGCKVYNLLCLIHDVTKPIIVYLFSDFVF